MGMLIALSGLSSCRVTFVLFFKKASFEQTLWRQRLRDRIAERTAEFGKDPSLSIVFTVGDIQQAVSKLKRGT